MLRLLVGSLGQRVLQLQVPKIVELLLHREWGVRCAAMEALKLVPDMIDQACAARRVLQLQHHDWGLRQVALEALALLESDALAAVAVQVD